MRKVPIREFQQHFHQTLKDLPFVVTSRGVAVCVVTSPKDTQAQTEKNVVTSANTNVVTKPKHVVTSPVSVNTFVKEHHSYEKPTKGSASGKVTTETKKKFINEYADKNEDWSF